MFDATKVLTPEVLTLGKVFSNEGFALRVVGGAVRDLFLDKTPKDIDFTTDATPSEMIAFLEAAGWRTIPTGIEHGTISVLGSLDEPYEITTLRIDAATDGRHADVEFTRDFRLDAERRDLTFNAMSMDMDGNVFDYFGGQADLENNVVKFVGDAETRIQEDYLRILRYFRFMGRMNSVSIDFGTAKAINDNAAGLKQISGERIWSELRKILKSDHAEDLMMLMCRTGVAAAASIPCNFEGLRDVPSNHSTTLLAFLCASQDDVDAVVARFRPANWERDMLSFLVNTNVDLQVAKVLSTQKVSTKVLAQMFLLNGNTADASAIKRFKVPTFPVTGKDLLASGMQAGPDMGKTLKAMKDRWAESGFELTKEELL